MFNSSPSGDFVFYITYCVGATKYDEKGFSSPFGDFVFYMGL